MSRFCTQCGTQRSGAARLCTSCGAVVSDGAAAPMPPPPTSVTHPPRQLRCVECSAPIDAGLVCARCASAPQPSRSTPSPHAEPMEAQATSGEPAPEAAIPGPRWQRHWLAQAAFWSVAAFVMFLWLNQKTHGRFGRDASAVGQRISNAAANGGLDGTYVCADGPVPWTMTIKIVGATGSMDLGALSARNMRVERRGDTVSMSGGQAYDAEGRSIDARTRAAMGDGNDVDLLTVGDDGLSLTLDTGKMGKAKFVKQP